ncbi:MAG TPA: sarcosine oxidase subunit gamma family protein [Beijerinckiaceae bacterium]|nr:sarcosine oxidase subunit gamma family protein [Beijerinckiaceae bacterium]
MSDAPTAPWAARGAWYGVVAAGRHGCDRSEPGVRASPREGLNLATIIGHRGRSAELDRLLFEALGAEPPRTPQVVRASDGELIWSGPDQWLLASRSAELMRQVAARLAGVAAVSDQSDARAVLRLWGPQIRNVLAKGCLIDLHPRAFRPGDVALTSIAHIGVQLWQIDDGSTYELAVYRSMALSFWSWFEGAAAEYGYEIIVGDGRN